MAIVSPLISPLISRLISHPSSRLISRLISRSSPRPSPRLISHHSSRPSPRSSLRPSLRPSHPAKSPPAASRALVGVCFLLLCGLGGQAFAAEAAEAAKPVQQQVLQWVFYASILIATLFLIAPTRKMMGKLFEMGLGRAFLTFFNGLVFLVKTIITSHVAIIWHLTHSRKNIFLVPEDEDIGGLFGKRKRGKDADE